MAETTNKSYSFNQVMVALTVGMSTIAATLTLGYTSPAIPSMFSDPNFDVTDDQASWIGSVLPFSALLGSLTGGHLVDTMGRKGALLLIALPFTLSWAMIAMATDVTLVVLGRLIGGACVGIQTVAAAVYMGEIVELELKGALVALPGAMGVGGLLLSFVMGQYLMWRDLAWFGASITLTFAIMQLLQPESPLYLLKKAEPKKALSVLQSIRRNDKIAQEELEALKLSCTSTSSNDKESIADLLVAPNRWPVGISVLLMLFQQTTGINAVIFYAASIFEAAGADLDPGACSVLLGTVNFVACLINMALLPKVDRTRLLYYSSLFVVPSLGLLGGYFIAKDAGGEWEDLADNLSFVPLASLLVYMVSFGMGWGPVPWIFMGEGLPSRVRGLGSAATACSNWGGAFLVTKMFNESVKSLGSGGTFLGFAIFTVVGQMIIGPNMPETRNMSMQEIDQMYEKSKAKKED